MPPNYEPRVLETRVVFVHGGSADTPAVEPVHCSEGGANCSYYTYTGFTSRLSNWTRLPVLAFDFPTEPVAPWPSNIRHVLEYLHHALLHGPRGGGRAGGLILVADSEGSLVAMQAVTAVLDASLRTLMGYGATLANPSRWLRRIVLSSPVVDVECTTASFAWNCCVRHGLDPSRTRTLCARALCRLACPLFIWSSYGCMADPFALGSVPSSLQAGTRQAAAEIPTLGCARTWQPQARSSRRACPGQGYTRARACASCTTLSFSLVRPPNSPPTMFVFVCVHRTCGRTARRRQRWPTGSATANGAT